MSDAGDVFEGPIVAEVELRGRIGSATPYVELAFVLGEGEEADRHSYGLPLEQAIELGRALIVQARAGFAVRGRRASLN